MIRNISPLWQLNLSSLTATQDTGMGSCEIPQAESWMTAKPRAGGAGLRPGDALTLQVRVSQN